MTKIVIWCRHKNDNIIGIGNTIPWRIPSDLRRFRHLTEGKTLVAGKNTYESFPNRTLPNRKILVVVNEPDYKVSDPENHFVISDLKMLENYTDDLYISGGASIYKAFFTTEKLLPDIVVDSVYQGELAAGLNGNPVTVSPSVEVLEKKYLPLLPNYELDNVKTTVWVKKGDFVNQSVVKAICKYLETEGN